MKSIFKLDKLPKVTLVGAGPGDPELITLKGINALKAADIVLYDALVSPEILEMIPAGLPSWCVGKRSGNHSFSQESINELIVEFAYLYGHVVRLKGGDPFVFGRGSEEIEFAASHGVATAVVPGISSSIAVPAALNIPVTARGYSESFWVVTGTTRDGEISSDVSLAAQSTATVVILMGLGKLESLMNVFATHGKSETPVAVVQNGTLKDQRSVIATVSTITKAVEEAKVSAPAIIVVGQVVNFAAISESLANQQNKNLSAFQR
jgi:uroporphyrin-III C-methyltransferase